eukprot:jgi/Botrbrau1/8231/Bobra.0392s0027.1
MRPLRNKDIEPDQRAHSGLRKWLLRLLSKEESGEEERICRLYVYTCKSELLPYLVEALGCEVSEGAAWLLALNGAIDLFSFPYLMRVYRDAIPSWIADRKIAIATLKDLAAVGDTITVRPANKRHPRSCQKYSLAAFQDCRFQNNFASEGMLMNDPPIPLRVLGYLGTQDLLNLSRVCKATHYAAHHLLIREAAVLDDDRMFPMGCLRPPERHHLMRICSLLSGSPEAVLRDVDKDNVPDMFLGYTCHLDYCTQPRCAFEFDGDTHEKLHNVKSALLRKHGTRHRWCEGNPAYCFNACNHIEVIDDPDKLRACERAFEQAADADVWRLAFGDSDIMRFLDEVRAVFAAARNHAQPVIVCLRPPDRRPLAPEEEEEEEAAAAEEEEEEEEEDDDDDEEEDEDEEEEGEGEENRSAMR